MSKISKTDVVLAWARKQNIPVTWFIHTNPDMSGIPMAPPKNKLFDGDPRDEGILTEDSFDPEEDVFASEEEEDDPFGEEDEVNELPF